MIRRLICAGLVLFGGLCAAVVGVGLFLSAPKPSSVGRAPPDLGAEDVLIHSPSGTTLHGWWVPGAHGAVMLMHGNGGNRRQMLARARVLHGQGYAVLLYDSQAHGETPGARITYGKREGIDAVAALQFVRARAPGQSVAAIGISLGGAAALLSPEPLAVDALVLEAVYPDIGSALSNRLRIGLGPVLGRVMTPVLTPLFETLLPPLLGVTPAELRPIDRVGQVTAPLLILCGTIDRYTPLTEAQALFDRVSAPKQFWAVEGAAHVDLEQFDPPAYWSRVNSFLGSHIH